MPRLMGAGPLGHCGPGPVVERETDLGQALVQGGHRIGLELGEGDVGEPVGARPFPEIHGPPDGDPPPLELLGTHFEGVVPIAAPAPGVVDEAADRAHDLGGSRWLQRKRAFG